MKQDMNKTESTHSNNSNYLNSKTGELKIPDFNEQTSKNNRKPCQRLSGPIPRSMTSK